ncbi:hypothetical protein [Streptomyces wuyuanensis]|uniref:hypothetical protein n=1 Tax=Streptomyces wuyuanensis TaxID=1196353 RepID=UPI003711180D
MWSGRRYDWATVEVGVRHSAGRGAALAAPAAGEHRHEHRATGVLAEPWLLLPVAALVLAISLGD